MTSQGKGTSAPLNQDQNKQISKGLGSKRKEKVLDKVVQQIIAKEPFDVRARPEPLEVNFEKQVGLQAKSRKQKDLKSDVQAHELQQKIAKRKYGTYVQSGQQPISNI